MDEKIEVRLHDKITLEGKPTILPVPSLAIYQIGNSIESKGIYLNDVHRTDLVSGEAIPLAKLVFIPYASILYIVLKQ